MMKVQTIFQTQTKLPGLQILSFAPKKGLSANFHKNIDEEDVLNDSNLYLTHFVYFRNNRHAKGRATFGSKHFI